MQQGLLMLAVAAYVASFVFSFWHARLSFAVLASALIPHAIAIGLGWQATGHGPYVGLLDSVSSNLWLQAMLFLLLAAVSPTVRSVRTPAMALCALFAVWLLWIPDDSISLPPTYDIWWLYLHLYTGKLAYALLFVAASVALTRDSNTDTERVGYHIMLAAFLSHSILLFSGANWAYSAWGHYWDWNTLEVWSLLTWLAFGFYFHARAMSASPWLPEPRWLITTVYLCSILTFYGIPFLSKASHQGLV